MITSLIAGDLRVSYSDEDLKRKLVEFGRVVDGKRVAPEKMEAETYLDLSKNRTTDTPRRAERQRIFLKNVNAL